MTSSLSGRFGLRSIRCAVQRRRVQQAGAPASPIANSPSGAILQISFNFSVPYIDEYMPQESAFK
jgi:hypothetical protein